MDTCTDLDDLARTLDELAGVLAHAAVECRVGVLPRLSTVADVQRRTGVALADLVAVTRACGGSWAEVGRELGCSRQAAHDRFRSTTTAP